MSSSYKELIQHYQMPQCCVHKNEKLQRICLSSQCKYYGEICCLECVEANHEHSIKLIPKLKLVFEKIAVQINTSNSDAYLFDEQQFNNNNNELQGLSRLETIQKQVKSSQQDALDNIGFQFGLQGKKWITLGEEMNKMILNNDKNAIKKWQQSNLNQVNSLLLEILDSPLDFEVLRGNLKKLQFHTYVTIPNEGSAYLQIKKFNILFDIQDFEEDLLHLKTLYDNVIDKIKSKLEINESHSMHQKNNPDNMNLQNYPRINKDQFEEFRLNLWKKSLSQAYNKCLRYVNQKEKTCLVMYNFPGYCSHCQMILDIYQQTIEQLKSKIYKR